MIHGDHEQCNAKLTELQKNKSKFKKGRKEESGTLPPKRRTQPVELFSAEMSRGKRKVEMQMSQEEKKKRRIQASNCKEAEIKANRHIFDRLNKQAEQKDPDWRPEDKKSEEDEESDDSIIGNVLVHTKEKETRTSLLKTLKNPESDFSSRSPTKEELKKQNELLKMKLQMVNVDFNVANPGHKPGRSKNSPVTSSQKSTPEKDMEYLTVRMTPSLGSMDTIDTDVSYTDKDEANIENSRDLTNVTESSFDKSRDKGDLNDGDCVADLGSVSKQFNHQLYGKQEDTTELCHNISCKTDVLAVALTSSTSVNHLVRRLMSGVFIPSQIKDCTVTGQSWHAGPHGSAQEVMTPLHQEALVAIVDFANSVATKKKWHAKKFKALKPIMSNRLNEMKKAVKSGKIRD